MTQLNMVSITQSYRGVVVETGSKEKIEIPATHPTMLDLVRILYDILCFTRPGTGARHALLKDVNDPPIPDDDFIQN